MEYVKRKKENSVLCGGEERKEGMCGRIWEKKLFSKGEQFYVGKKRYVRKGGRA